MIRNFKNKGVYSEEHKKFIIYVKDKNNKINDDIIDKNTIKLVDNYLKKLTDVSLDILKESLEKRNKDIELDLTVFISRSLAMPALVISIVALFISIIPMYDFFNDKKSIISAICVSISLIGIIPALQTFGFYFKRKNELLFCYFVLRRIQKLANDVEGKKKSK